MKKLSAFEKAIVILLLAAILVCVFTALQFVVLIFTTESALTKVVLLAFGLIPISLGSVFGYLIQGVVKPYRSNREDEL